jgi:glycosyltransferase involved in cell wall biosynthesis
MTPISILHLVNKLADTSISRIILEIIKYTGNETYTWYVGSFLAQGDMTTAFQKAGAIILDYSGESAITRLKSDLSAYQVKILHSHTPRTTIQGWRAVSTFPYHLRPKHVTTKHLLTRVKDRRWGMIYTLADYLSLYLPDHLIPVSQTMYKQIISLPAMPWRKVTAIPNGIPIGEYANNPFRSDARRELNIAKESIVFGFAGRLDQVKRIDLLLIAFQQATHHIPDARLLILGEGQLKNELQVMANQLGIATSVIWAGFRKDIPRMLAAMDIYIQPSDNEGLSLSILEAMAARRPIIATQVGAANEVLAHKKTGWLIPPGSSHELCDAMVYLVNHKETLEIMVEAAYDHVRDHYSTDSMATAYKNVYAKLLQEVQNA